MILGGLIQPCDEMVASWTCRARADTEPARQLGLAGGRKRSAFFVPDADPLDLAPPTASANGLSESPIRPKTWRTPICSRTSTSISDTFFDIGRSPLLMHATNWLGERSVPRVPKIAPKVQRRLRNCKLLVDRYVVRSQPPQEENMIGHQMVRTCINCVPSGSFSSTMTLTVFGSPRLWSSSIEKVARRSADCARCKRITGVPDEDAKSVPADLSSHLCVPT